MDETKFAFNFTFAMGLACLLIIALGAIGYWVLYPAFLHQQADAVLNSQQFAITGQQEINDAIESYNSLQTQIDELSGKTDAASIKLVKDLGKQQNTAVCDVRRAVNMLPADKVSTRARNFLAENTSVNCK